jgi:hypothetical protein
MRSKISKFALVGVLFLSVALAGAGKAEARDNDHGSAISRFFKNIVRIFVPRTDEDIPAPPKPGP